MKDGRGGMVGGSGGRVRRYYQAGGGSSRGYSFGERVQLPPSNDCTGAGATPPQRPQVAAQ